MGSGRGLFEADLHLDPPHLGRPTFRVWIEAPDAEQAERSRLRLQNAINAGRSGARLLELAEEFAASMREELLREQVEAEVSCG